MVDWIPVLNGELCVRAGGWWRQRRLSLCRSLSLSLAVSGCPCLSPCLYRSLSLSLSFSLSVSVGLCRSLTHSVCARVLWRGCGMWVGWARVKENGARAAEGARTHAGGGRALGGCLTGFRPVSQPHDMRPRSEPQRAHLYRVCVACAVGPSPPPHTPAPAHKGRETERGRGQGRARERARERGNARTPTHILQGSRVDHADARFASITRTMRRACNGSRRACQESRGDKLDTRTERRGQVEARDGRHGGRATGSGGGAETGPLQHRPAYMVGEGCRVPWPQLL